MKALLKMAVAAAALIAMPAAAQNIVTNSGFEAGSTGWYANGMSIFQSNGDGHNNSNWLAATGCVGSSCNGTYNQGSFFGQTLNTVANQSYNLSFWVAETAGATSAFSVFWGGQLVNTTFNPNNNSGLDGYRQFTFSGLIASGASTDLQIQGRQDPAGIYFDDVSVVAANGAVPEPATWAMMLLGFGAMGAALRRRPRATVRFA